MTVTASETVPALADDHLAAHSEEPAAAPDGATGPVEDGLVEEGLVEEDLLVEDVSIDGMCGVY